MPRETLYEEHCLVVSLWYANCKSQGISYGMIRQLKRGTSAQLYLLAATTPLDIYTRGRS